MWLIGFHLDEIIKTKGKMVTKHATAILEKEGCMK